MIERRKIGGAEERYEEMKKWRKESTERKRKNIVKNEWNK
jgi:hypothetical protein